MGTPTSDITLVSFAGGGQHNREGRCLVVSVCPLQPLLQVRPGKVAPASQAESLSLFCLPQKGETVKRIREQVRVGCGEGKGDPWPTSSSNPTVWGDQRTPPKGGGFQLCWGLRRGQADVLLGREQRSPAARRLSCARRAAPGSPSPRAPAPSASPPSPGRRRPSSTRSP